MKPTDPKWKTAATTWKAEEERFTKLLWSLLRGKLADVVKEMQPGVARLLHNRGELLGMDLKSGQSYDKLATSLLNSILLSGPLDADFVRDAVENFSLPFEHKEKTRWLPQAPETIEMLVNEWVRGSFYNFDDVSIKEGIYHDSFLVELPIVGEMDGNTLWKLVDSLEKHLTDELTRWTGELGVRMQPTVYAEPTTLRNKEAITVSIRF